MHTLTPRLPKQKETYAQNEVSELFEERAGDKHTCFTKTKKKPKPKPKPPKKCNEKYPSNSMQPLFFCNFITFQVEC